jgi:dihydrofolate synthase/folylpolyglutamate synthase
MELLGNPHLAVPVLHVAGTNGKGSTCAFAEAALRAAGLRTGLYTSPHLVHFCERIRIGGEPIGEQYAAQLLEEIVRHVPWALRDDGLTFFELATAMAFLAFARERVQIAVVEVGLGGRLDATNVVEPLACAVAPIGLDHMQWLGPTLAHVAAEKAGILKRGAPAVSAGQPRAAADVLARRAAELGIPLWRPGRDYVYESRDVGPFCYAGPRGFRVSLREREEVVGGGEDGARPPCSAETVARWASGGLALLGHHQRENAALACALVQIAAERGVPVRPEHLRVGLRTARWPGRLEVVAANPLVLVDGAHNVHAARAVVRAVRAILTAGPPPTRSGTCSAIEYINSSRYERSEPLPRADPLCYSRPLERARMPERVRTSEPGRTVQLFFSAMTYKDQAGMLRELLPLAAGAHFCAVDSPRAAAPDRLAAVARDLAAQMCGGDATTPEAQGSALNPTALAAQLRVHPSVAEALQAARAAAGAEGTVLCCGSLYLVAEVQAAMRGRPVDRMPSERL